MKTRKKKRITARQRKAWANKATALRIDPTRTTTLRRRMCTDFTKRLNKIKLAISDLLLNQQVLRFQWGTLPTEQKVTAFTNWLSQVFNQQLIGFKSWWANYQLAAYLRGATRSYDEVKRRKRTDQLVHLGGKQEFIRHLMRKQVQAKPVVNAGFDPTQHRDDHGRWARLSDAVVGTPRDRPLRGHDHPDLELRQASEGARDATRRANEATIALMKYRFPNDVQLRREYWESMFLGIESFAPWRDQQWPVSVRRGVKATLERSTDAQAGMAFGNLHQAQYEGRTSKTAMEQHSRAADYHNYLARVIKHQGRMWLVSSIQEPESKERVEKRLAEVVKRHEEAAALHRDAYDMLEGSGWWTGSPWKPLTNAGFDPDQPRDDQGRWERLSDSATHPYQGGRKEQQSPLEEGLEASKAAEEISDRLDMLTKDFLTRLRNNPELDHVHDLVDDISRQVYWTQPQLDTIKEFRDILEGKRKSRWSGEGDNWQDLVSVHHWHQFDQHRKIISGLTALHNRLPDNRTVKDLLKRHREAAFLHSDAREMLEVRNTLTANVQPYVSEEDVATFGSRLQALAQRLRNEIDGITWAMAQRIARVLQDGLEQEWSAERIATEINAVVDAIGKTRALAIANTELIRAHADGQLDALEDLGEEEVTAAVEWNTAKDNKVCKLCKPLEGVILHISEARGLIPRHVGCRCSWSAAVPTEDKVLKDSLEDVRKAIKTSIVASPAQDSWFEGKSVRRQRPVVNWTPVANENCGTGAGGFKPGNTCAAEDGQKDNDSKALVKFNQSVKKLVDSYDNNPKVKETTAKLEETIKRFNKALGVWNTLKVMVIPSARIKYIAELTRFKKEADGLKSELGEIARKELLKNFSTPYKQRPAVNMQDHPYETSRLSPETAERVRNTIKEFVIPLCDKKHTGPSLNIVLSKTIRTDGRDSYSPMEYGRGRLLMTANCKPQNIVHEFAHHIEQVAPGAKAKQNQFDAKLFGKEKPVDLSKVTLGGMKPGTEYGRKDNLTELLGKDWAYYAGKRYPKDNCGELISVGMEFLYRNPARFAKVHPEYFKFLIDVLQGT